MNILVLARGYPDLKYSMNGIFEYDQAKALAAIGHSVTYFAIDLRSVRRKRKFGIIEEHRDGVHIYCINIPIGAVPQQVLVSIGTLALKRLYTKVYGLNGRPDIIHAHFYSIGYMASKLKEREHIPLVITEHSSEINFSNWSLNVFRMARYAYTSADCVIAVSNPLANNIHKKTGVFCTVIPNIVCVNDFILKNKPKHKPFTVVSTGNLIPRKRMNLLIDAFSILHSRYPNTRLNIIGDGPDRSMLMKKVSNLGLEVSIHFLGRCSRHDIAKEYEKCHCFALPSSLETFGVVYIEAMASGLPVIATRCGGPESFMSEECGFLIDVDDLPGLVDALEKMYLNIQNFDRQKISDFSVSNFSPDTVAQLLTRCYQSQLDEAHL